jgi:hypothetical protein
MNVTHPLSIMTKSLKLILVALIAACLPAGALFAHDCAAHAKAKTPPAGQAQADGAKAGYPLNTCVVSGSKLERSSMGDPVDYTHKEAGKPDRLVRFCCKGCIPAFQKDPAKHLKKIDDAAAAKAKDAAGHAGHGGHNH